MYEKQEEKRFLQIDNESPFFPSKSDSLAFNFLKHDLSILS
jgi:hypothetical protein